MADWASDVKKYAPNADDKVIAGIVKHCGIALQKQDSSLVSFSDKAETDRVRDGFLKKKLALTDSVYGTIRAVNRMAGAVATQLLDRLADPEPPE